MKIIQMFSRWLIFLVLFACISTPLLAEAKSSVLNDEQNKWLQENFSSISFAPESDFPPMIWSRYGDVLGVSKDYFDFIQQLIDVRFPVQKPRSLSEILEAIKVKGEISIISSRTITPERSEYLLFTRPYFSSPVIFISKNKKTLTGKEIEQKKYSVVVESQSGAYEYLENRYPEMKLVAVENSYKIIEAVSNQKADIGAINIASLAYLIKENNFSDIRKIGDTGFVVDFSFAVPKNLPELRNILDDAIEVIPESFKKLVLDKWNVNFDGTQQLVNEQAIVFNEEKITKTHLIFLVVATSLFIILVNFILDRYLLKQEEKRLHLDK